MKRSGGRQDMHCFLGVLVKSLDPLRYGVVNGSPNSPANFHSQHLFSTKIPD